MSEARSHLAAIAEIISSGQLTLAADLLKAGLEAVPGMRQHGELALLHREVIQHKGSSTRLERDCSAGRLMGETEQVERAKLTAALLDVIDEIGAQLRSQSVEFKVDRNIVDAAMTGLHSTEQISTDVGTRTDVFLSYSRPDRSHVIEMALLLRKRSCSVWYDHYITAGARFRDEINARLSAARAVVVLWSEHSVQSDWVLYEADVAHKARKLVPVRLAALPVERVPAPYPAVLNILSHDDHDGLVAALQRLGSLN